MANKIFFILIMLNPIAIKEIGIKKDNIETLGLLPPHETVSQFIIYPFVGFIKKPTSFFINKNEVEELFFVPLVFLLKNIPQSVFNLLGKSLAPGRYDRK